MTHAGETDAEVRPIRADDAPGLAALISRCYGDGYPKRVMYRPDELAELIRSGSHCGAVADAAGEVVGHMAFTWPDPDATVVEAGITVVDPQWRGKGLMGRLALEMGRLAIEDGAVGFVHFPTTAHEVMQRASVASGGRETGIMVAFLPPGTRDHEIAEQGEGRLCVTVVYQPMLEAPAQSIHVPGPYGSRILQMAAALGLDRTVEASRAAAEGESEFETSFDRAQGVLQLRVVSIGADLGEAISSAMRESGGRLVHADLPMNDPAIDDAVGQLRSLEFAYSAWLPGWAGHDVLRMQRIEAPTDEELSPTLFSDDARALMDAIRVELPGSA